MSEKPITWAEWTSIRRLHAKRWMTQEIAERHSSLSMETIMRVIAGQIPCPPEEPKP